MPVPRPALFAALLLCAVVALSWNLSGFRLLDPDEGRNAEVAREMAATNDYIVPHLDGLPYLDKPIVYFAAAAATMEILGPTELAARLPSYAAALGTILLIMWFARRRFGPLAAWIAGIAYATMPLVLGYSHTAMFDSLLTLFTTAAILSWFEGNATFAWIALAAGALCKGPIALAIPLAVIVPFSLLRGEPLRRLVSLRAVAAFAVVGLPWFFAVTHRFPEFPSYAFVTETLQRFTTPAFHRTQPVWFYVPVLLLGTFPWILPASARVREWRMLWSRRHESPLREAVLLVSWVVGPFVLLTLNHSKLAQYVLPLCPAIALAAAQVLATRGARASWRAYVVIAPVLAVGLFLLSVSNRTLINLTAAERAAIPPTAVALGVVLLASAAGVALAARRESVMLAAASYGALVISLAFTSGSVVRAVGDDRSAAGIAAAVHPVLAGEGGESIDVLGVAAYPPSLPFYLQRTVSVATESATELTSTYIARYQHQYREVVNSPLLPAISWRERLATCERPTVFIVNTGDVASRATLATLPLLGVDQRYAAYGPCRSPSGVAPITRSAHRIRTRRGG